MASRGASASAVAKELSKLLTGRVGKGYRNGYAPRGARSSSRWKRPGPKAGDTMGSRGEDILEAFCRGVVSKAMEGAPPETRKLVFRQMTTSEKQWSDIGKRLCTLVAEENSPDWVPPGGIQALYNALVLIAQGAGTLVQRRTAFATGFAEAVNKAGGLPGLPSGGAPTQGLPAPQGGGEKPLTTEQEAGETGWGTYVASGASGAATGAMVGGPWGALIGAAAGIGLAAVEDYTENDDAEGSGWAGDVLDAVSSMVTGDEGE